MAKRGRGNVIQDATAEAVLVLVQGGLSVAAAAKAHDYSDRTIYRYAAAHPDYATRLTVARATRDEARFPVRHGTRTGYNRGCRKPCCREANTRAAQNYRELRKQHLPPGAVAS